MKLGPCLSGVVLLAANAFAGGAPPILRLWPGDPPATQVFDSTDKVDHRKDGTINISNILHPSMAVYLPTANAAAQPDASRPAVVICPGGAYGVEASTLEGSDEAVALNAHGVVAFVLRYRLPDGHAPAAGALPVPQQDVLRALQIVRARAAEWNVDPKRVGVMGFSAGGHLAATAATMFDQAGSLAALSGNDAISKTSARPDFAVLMYPVISMDKARTDKGTRKHLIGADANAELTDRYSAQLHVTPQTPPLLIVQAEDDRIVQPINAVQMATAAAAQHVPCELILLQSGGHGFGLGKPGTEPAEWFGDLMLWMRSRGLTK